MEISNAIGQFTIYVMITLLDTLGGVFLISFMWISVRSYLRKREESRQLRRNLARRLRL